MGMSKESRLLFNEIKAIAMERLSEKKIKKLRAPGSSDILKIPKSAGSEAGEFWRNRREIVGLKQSELGRQLKYSNGQFVSNIERGLCGIPLERVVEYCKILGINKSEARQILLTEYSAKLDKILEDFNSQLPDI